MTDDDNAQTWSVPVAPIGAIVVALALAAAAAAYLRTESGGAIAESAAQRVRPSRNVRRKVLLTTLVTLIENDTTRKVVVAALKAMARRG